MDSTTRVFVYETTSADPSCADPALRAQGQAMLDAMVADLGGVHGVQVTAAVGAGKNSATTARVHHARRRREEAPVDFLRRQAMVHDLVWVVAPETAGLLLSLRGAVTDNQWIGCSRQAIEIAGSKRSTVEHLRAAGIATPPALRSPALRSPALGSLALQSLHPGEACAQGDLSGCWIVKPDDGCGAAGARRYADHPAALADYRERRQRGENVVMERWIDGEPLSLSLLCGGDDVEVLAVNRQRIGIDAAGWLRFDGVSPLSLAGSRGRACNTGNAGRTGNAGSETFDGKKARDLSILAGKIVKALPGLRGFVGVDVTWHPGRGAVVIEINPRLTCAYEGLSARTGRNLAGEILAMHRRRLGMSNRCG